MNRLLIPLLASAALAAACSNQPDEVVAEVSAPATGSVESPALPTQLAGPVLETMDSGGYTYVLVETTQGEFWAAAPPTKVKVGQVVEVADPMPMQGFESRSLERHFDLIYFASGLSAPGEEAMPTGSAAPPAESGVSAGDVAKADGGQTVEEVIVGKDQFVGKEILVRGKVVKFTPQVMNKNWLHVQDGSGAAGTNDLTVTTAAEVAVGDVVLVRGVLAADKDFGFGYAYDLIVEDAQVTVE